MNDFREVSKEDFLHQLLTNGVIGLSTYLQLKGSSIPYILRSMALEKETMDYLTRNRITDECKPINNNKMDELKVTKEKVLEAAKVSKEGEEVLKKLFPKVFEEEYYDFGKEFKVNLEFNDLHPFTILYGKATTYGDRNKVLLVNRQYSIEVIHNYIDNCDAIKLKINK